MWNWFFWCIYTCTRFNQTSILEYEGEQVLFLYKQIKLDKTYSNIMRPLRAWQLRPVIPARRGWGGRRVIMSLRPTYNTRWVQGLAVPFFRSAFRFWLMHEVFTVCTFLGSSLLHNYRRIECSKSVPYYL